MGVIFIKKKSSQKLSHGKKYFKLNSGFKSASDFKPASDLSPKQVFFSLKLETTLSPGLKPGQTSSISIRGKDQLVRQNIANKKYFNIIQIYHR